MATNVIWTGAGDRYHATRECPKLHTGVRSAEVHGRKVHPQNTTSVETALQAGRTKCPHCVTGE
jgi:hypothetical protein